MRIVLQHKNTGLYFRDIEDWTRHSSEALDFVSSTAAIEFCQTNRIDFVQIVLKFERENFDIVMQPDVFEPASAKRRVHLHAT